MERLVAYRHHKRYGTSRRLAVFEYPLKNFMRRIIRKSRRKITSTESKSSCMPKNTILQSVFTMRCATKNQSTNTFPNFFDLATKYAAVPISTYRVVHTGPKTQLGGVQLGRTKVAYQVSILPAVANEPTNPARREIPMKKTSERRFAIRILSSAGT